MDSPQSCSKVVTSILGLMQTPCICVVIWFHHHIFLDGFIRTDCSVSLKDPQILWTELWVKTNRIDGSELMFEMFEIFIPVFVGCIFYTSILKLKRQDEILYVNAIQFQCASILQPVFQISKWVIGFFHSLNINIYKSWFFLQPSHHLRITSYFGKMPSIVIISKWEPQWGQFKLSIWLSVSLWPPSHQEYYRQPGVTHHLNQSNEQGYQKAG